MPELEHDMLIQSRKDPLSEMTFLRGDDRLSEATFQFEIVLFSRPKFGFEIDLYSGKRFGIDSLRRNAAQFDLWQG